MSWRVDKLTLLEYALEGVQTLLGTSTGYISEELEEDYEKDIAELKKRIEKEKQK